MGALGGLGGILGGIVGGIANNGDEDAAKAAYAAALAQIQGLQQDKTYTDPVVLEALQQGGELTPELLQKLALNADNKTELIENPQDKQQQQYALNALKQMSQTGMSPADLAAERQIQRQVSGDTQAKINQILQQQQMRGQSSGGNALAAQLSAVQGAQQNESEQADRLAQQAQSARTGALSQFTNLAGQMRGTDLGVQQTNLQNDIARQNFLDQNSIARQTANANMSNSANAMNLQRQQNVGDTNTMARNSELYAQKQRQQQAYQNAAQKAAMMSGLYNQQGNRSTQAANATAQNFTNIGQGLGAGAESLLTMGAGGTSGGAPTAHPGSGALGVNTDLGSGISASSLGLAHGGIVPGQKKFPWDTILDDKVDTKLSPGEIVIPESHAHDPKLAKAFIDYLHHGPTPKKGSKE